MNSHELAKKLAIEVVRLRSIWSDEHSLEQ